MSRDCKIHHHLRPMTPYRSGHLRVPELDVIAMEVVRPRLGSEAVVAKPVTPDLEPRMDAHQNARTTPRSRMLIVARLREGWTVSAVATALGIAPKTVRKRHDWLAAETSLRTSAENHPSKYSPRIASLAMTASLHIL
jgi:hypothetical protein